MPASTLTKRTMVAVAWLVVAACAARSKVTAADIVAKNLAARGGLEAWRKIQTMVWIGYIESATAPSRIPFRLAQKRPNKTRLQITMLGDNSLRLFDGVRGWKLRAGRGRPVVQPYTPQEIKFAQGGHAIDGPLIDSAAKDAPVSLLGVEQIGERKAYHLRLRDEDVWVDTETYLEIRSDRSTDGTRRVSTTYGEYREVQGLQIPFLIESGGGSGTQPDKMRIDKVVLNAPLDDALFENPNAAPLGSPERPTADAQEPPP